MQDMKQCPFCSEEIKAVATICRYCRSDLKDLTKDEKGKLVTIRLKAGENIYFGDIFLPSDLRASDIINDERDFIILSNAFEETRMRDAPIGFLSINKNLTEWVQFKDQSQPEETETKNGTSRELD